jgi:hypothetical protein
MTEEDNSLKLMWAPAHTGIKGNEEAAEPNKKWRPLIKSSSGLVWMDKEKMSENGQRA